MRKFRIFVVELILAGIFVAWFFESLPELVDKAIPWIVFAILWHLVIEIGLDREWSKRQAAVALRKWGAMTWFIAFVIGGSVSLLFFLSSKKLISAIRKPETATSEIVKERLNALTDTEPPSATRQLRDEETLRQLRELDRAGIEAIRIVLVGGPSLPNKIESRLQSEGLSTSDRQVVTEVRAKTTFLLGSFSGEVSLNPDLKESVEQLLPSFLASPLRPSVPLTEPIIHIEPENEAISSTGPGQTQGVFELKFDNTGSEDIDHIRIIEDYFVALRLPNGIVIKNLGGVPIQAGVPASLRSGRSHPLFLDFRAQVEVIKSVIKNNSVPSLPGVRLTITFRRKADGREYRLVKGYGSFGPAAPVLFPPGIPPEQFMRSMSDKGFLSISEVVPLLDVAAYWVPVTDEITQDSQGNPIHSYR